MPLPNLSQAVLPDDWQKGGFGLYIHWPYCASKCPYCDFNSHISGQVDQRVWRSAYLTALQAYAFETGGRPLRSIYFGGGTPSLMQPDLVGAIIDAAQRHWVFENSIEITLEANPNSVEVGRFQSFRHAGVNRVSLGIQALYDPDLRRLGRMHTAKDALKALEIARATFPRVSFDLIYARQEQEPADWRKELALALSLNPDHLSLYQLSIEPGTVFAARQDAGKLPGLPGEEKAAYMYEDTVLMCKNEGLIQYEVSNFAHEEAISKHNMIYWQAGDYLGVGPGAHGRISLSDGRFATETPLKPQAWLEATNSSGSGESMRVVLNGQEQVVEYLLMGLRTRGGVLLSRLAAMDKWHANTETVDHLIELGLLVMEGDRLAVTSKGMPLLNAILRDLTP